jgi:hypothetical protein
MTLFFIVMIPYHNCNTKPLIVIEIHVLGSEINVIKWNRAFFLEIFIDYTRHHCIYFIMPIYNIADKTSVLKSKNVFLIATEIIFIITLLLFLIMLRLPFQCCTL